MCVYCKTSYIISIPKRWKKKLKDDADGAAGVTDQGKGVVEIMTIMSMLRSEK